MKSCFPGVVCIKTLGTGVVKRKSDYKMHFQLMKGMKGTRIMQRSKVAGRDLKKKLIFFPSFIEI